MAGDLSTPTPQKALLLDAAIDLLRREGAAGLTVRNVAKLADCSTTGVYTHFGGKDGLVEAIFIDGFISFDAAIATASSLREAGQAYRDWALANPTHYLVMFGKAVPSYSPSPEALLTATQAFDRLVDITQSTMPETSAHAVRTEAYNLWATIHGYVMLGLVDMTPPDLPGLSELYENGLDLALRHLDQHD